MDSYSLKGKIAAVFDLEQKTEKFRKREFVVETNTSNERGTFVEFIKFQTVMSNCDLLNDVNPGDLVVVRWALMGRRWGKKGEYKYFTNVEALEITVVQRSNYNAADDAIEESFPLGDKEEDDPIGVAPQSSGGYDDNDGVDDLPF